MPDLDEIFPVRKGKLGIIDAVISQVFDACWEEVTKKEEEKGKNKIFIYVYYNITFSYDILQKLWQGWMLTK